MSGGEPRYAFKGDRLRMFTPSVGTTNGCTWQASFDTITGTNIGVDERLNALRTICAHALDLADALDLAAMCGLTQENP